MHWGELSVFKFVSTRSFPRGQDLRVQAPSKLAEFTMGRQRRQAETRFIPNDFFPRANLSNDDLSQTSTCKEPL
jgi:hypothetical protein